MIFQTFQTSIFFGFHVNFPGCNNPPSPPTVIQGAQDLGSNGMKAIRHVAGHVFGCGRSALRSAGICPWTKGHGWQRGSFRNFWGGRLQENNHRIWDSIWGFFFGWMSRISTSRMISEIPPVQKFIKVPESIFQPVCKIKNIKRKILSVPVILVCESSPLGCGRWWFHWHPTPWIFGNNSSVSFFCTGFF